MNHVPLMTFGQLMGVARECKGWTLREMEAKTGISNAMLSQIETGKIREPGFWKAVKISRALGVPLERFAACAMPYR